MVCEPPKEASTILCCLRRPRRPRRRDGDDDSITVVRAINVVTWRRREIEEDRDGNFTWWRNLIRAVFVAHP